MTANHRAKPLFLALKKHSSSPYPKHAVLWQGAIDAARKSPVITTRLDGLEAMSAIILMLLHEEEQRNERAVPDFEGRVAVPPAPRFEDQLRALPVSERHIWLKQQLCEHLQERHFGIIQSWAQSTRLSAEAVSLAVSIFEPGELDFAAYADIKERPVYLLEAPFQAVELEAGRSGLAPTPAPLARFMVEMLDPKPGERIYDIACGTGSLMLAAWKHIETQMDRMSAREHQRIQQGTLFGIEQYPVAAFIALARLKLAGISRPRLFTNNVLTRTVTTTYDVVLCDPPWGMPLRIEHEGSTRSMSSEQVMLEDVLQHLAPGGRAGVLVPKGFLSRGGLEGRLRRRLLTEFRLEAVMDMPKGLLNFTTIAPTLLLIRHASPRLTVAFTDATLAQQFVKTPRDPGWEKVQIADVRNAINRETASDLVNAHVKHVIVDEILDNDALLESGRYTKDAEREFLARVLDEVKGAERRALTEVTEVFKGRSDWKPEESAIDETSTAIIRISDVSNARLNDAGLPEVNSCSRFLDTDQERVLRPELRLRPDDILFTVDGTVGKAALAGDTFQAAVAGQGLAVIRCSPQLNARYLLALLRTEPYLEIIHGLRTGNVISHLRISDLRKLPVPLLPMEMQHRLSSAKEGQSTATLLALLREDASFSTWERALLDSRHASALSYSDNQPATIEALLHFVEVDLQPLRPELPVLAKSEFAAARAFVQLAELAQKLRRITSMGDSSDKALVLQVLRQSSLPLKLGPGDGTSPEVMARMESVHAALLRLSRLEWERLLAVATLKLTASPNSLPLNEEQEVTLAIENTSTFPLVGIEVRPPGVHAPACEPMLSAGKSMHITLKITARDTAGINMQVPWRAMRVDMTEIRGQLELRLPVRAGEAQAKPSFVRNPYVCGPSLNERDVDAFFGREEIFDEIKSLLRPDGPSTVIILEGVRRVGKTSLLKQLHRPDMLPGWVPVYYDFQSADGSSSDYGVPTEDIFSCILRATLMACREQKINAQIPALPPGTFELRRPEFRSVIEDTFLPMYRAEAAPFSLFVGHIEYVIEALQGRRLLLMLDEFDKIQAGITNKVTSPQIAENFRSLFHSHREVSAILTGSQLMKRMRGEYFHPLFGIGRAIPINELDAAAAVRLVNEPAAGILRFRDSARNFIIEQSSCQPFIIQHLCSQCYALCQQAQNGDVTLEIATKAARRFMEDQSHFRDVWRDDIADARTQLLALLVQQAANSRQPATDALLRERVDALSIRPGHAFGDRLEELCNLHVLRRDRIGSQTVYAIAMPLFATWLSERETLLTDCVKRIHSHHDSTL